MYVIGHALFAADLKLQPTVTMGIVSKVNRVAGIPVMIQVSLYKICLLFFQLGAGWNLAYMLLDYLIFLPLKAFLILKDLKDHLKFAVDNIFKCASMQESLSLGFLTQ